MRADRRQVEDRRRTRQQEQRPHPGGGLFAQTGNQCLLRGAIEILFDHVDDPCARTFGFEGDEQRGQRRRRRRASGGERCRCTVDARLQCRIGAQHVARRRTVVFQPVEADERGAGQRVGEPERQPRLAAAERADDVVQRPDIATLEPLAAPRPRQAECHAGAAVVDEPGQFAVGRHPAAREAGADCVYAIDLAHEILNAVIQRRFVSGQCVVEAARVAVEHARHLRETEAECAQRGDVGRAGEIVRAVRTVPGRRAFRRDEAVPLVQPQRLDRDAEPRGGGRRIQTGRGRAHPSPLLAVDSLRPA